MPLPTSAEIEGIARQLAALRGQSIEEAVTTASRTELARERQSRAAAAMLGELTPAQRAKVERVMELVRAAGSAEGRTGEDPTAFLYDDQGLPG